ncbi:MAG: hypothetical protein EON93_01940 [Burkholderiales bacterium]|nr:MAG: hypothetical protein EON93_01940 [Burkholderiales bacterium]
MVDLIDDYFRAVDQGTPIAYLLDPHNFHRLPWFRGLIALDMSMLHGTGLPLVISGVLCLTGTAVLLMKEARRATSKLGTPLMILAGMLVFLTANAAGVSVPANTPHLHATFFSTLALITAASASMHGHDWRGWAVAIVCAAAASLSLATALVLWPILVLMALHARISWQLTCFICIAASAFCVAYMTGQPVGTSLQQGLDPHGLLKAAEYFFAYLGLPWVRGSRLLGELLGVALFAASVSVVLWYGFRRTDRTQRLALGMILFSLGSGVLAAVGRRDIALEIDVPVRYAILLAPLHVGLLLLSAPTILRIWNSRPRLVTQGMLAAVALLMIQQVMVAIVAVRAAERSQQTIALYQQGERTPEMLQWIFPDLDRAAAVYAEMRRRGVFLQWVGELKDPISPETHRNTDP